MKSENTIRTKYLELSQEIDVLEKELAIKDIENIVTGLMLHGTLGELKEKRDVLKWVLNELV